MSVSVGTGPDRLTVDHGYGDFVQLSLLQGPVHVFLYVRRANVPALIAALQAAVVDNAAVPS